VHCASELSEGTTITTQQPQLNRLGTFIVVVNSLAAVVSILVVGSRQWRKLIIRIGSKLPCCRVIVNWVKSPVQSICKGYINQSNSSNSSNTDARNNTAKITTITTIKTTTNPTKSTSPINYCPIHPGVPMYEYCFTDRALVCNVCRNHRHKDHDVKELEAAGVHIQEGLKRRLAQIEVYSYYFCLFVCLLLLVLSQL
jgi:hypothetical protein